MFLISPDKFGRENFSCPKTNFEKDKKNLSRTNLSGEIRNTLIIEILFYFILLYGFLHLASYASSGPFRGNGESLLLQVSENHKNMSSICPCDLV